MKNFIFDEVFNIQNETKNTFVKGLYFKEKKLEHEYIQSTMKLEKRLMIGIWIYFSVYLVYMLYYLLSNYEIQSSYYLAFGYAVILFSETVLFIILFLTENVDSYVKQKFIIFVVLDLTFVYTFIAFLADPYWYTEKINSKIIRHTNGLCFVLHVAYFILCNSSRLLNLAHFFTILSTFIVVTLLGGETLDKYLVELVNIFVFFFTYHLKLVIDQGMREHFLSRKRLNYESNYYSGLINSFNYYIFSITLSKVDRCKNQVKTINNAFNNFLKKSFPNIFNKNSKSNNNVIKINNISSSKNIVISDNPNTKNSHEYIQTTTNNRLLNNNHDFKINKSFLHVNTLEKDKLNNDYINKSTNKLIHELYHEEEGKSLYQLIQPYKSRCEKEFDEDNIDLLDRNRNYNPNRIMNKKTSNSKLDTQKLKQIKKIVDKEKDEKVEQNNNSNNIFNYEEEYNKIIEEENFKNHLTFKNLGVFTFCDSEDNLSYFDISFRRYKIKKTDYVYDFIINNISDLKKAEKSNTEMKLKQNLFSKIAHEFKTPLICITTMITDLNEHMKNNEIEKSQHMANSISTMSKYTIFLIDDIIHYSSNQKIDKEITTNIEEINIKDITSFCHEVLDCLLEFGSGNKNKIKTEVNIDELIFSLYDFKIMSDNLRLKQILLNLISNAVKFTRNGKITIEGKMNSDGDVEISVNDTGNGIDDEVKKRLFNSNEDRVINLNVNLEYNNTMGTGIGLNIVKNLCSILNHKIKCCDSPYKNILNTYGTSFVIVIPATPKTKLSKIKTPKLINKNMKFLLNSKLITENNGGVKLYNENNNISVSQENSYSNSSNYYEDESNLIIDTNMLDLSNIENKDIVIKEKKIKYNSNSLIESIKNKKSFLGLDKIKNYNSSINLIQDIKLTTNNFEKKDKNNSIINNLLISNKEKLKLNNKNKLNSVNKDNIDKKSNFESSSLIKKKTKNKTENITNYEKAIIVCDDYPLLRKCHINLFKDAFKEHNITDTQIIECSDGIEILMKVIEDQENGCKIKAVFTDENMLYCNGSRAVSHLKILEHLNIIPEIFYIVITAFSEDVINKLLESGFNKGLKKQPSKKDIAQALKEFGLI